MLWGWMKCAMEKATTIFNIKKKRTISRCCMDFLFQSLIIDTVFLCPFFVWSHFYNILLSFELRRISKDLKYVSNQKKMSKHNWSHFFKGEEKNKDSPLHFDQYWDDIKIFFTWNGAAAKILYIPTLHWFKAPPGNLHFLVKKRRDTTRGKFCTFLKKICGCGNTILWRVN